MTFQEHNEPVAHPAPTGTNREAQWQKCCKHAANLHRQPIDWLQYKAKLEKGYNIPLLDDQRLMSTALELVNSMVVAGVRRWDWLPAPTDDDLAQPEAWIEQRLALRKIEQDEAERDRRLRQKEARAFGLPTSNGTGIGMPVYRQKPKHSLDELVRRLRWTMDAHKAAGRAFTRELLDPNSPHYLDDRSNSITNKQIIMMANTIVEQRGGQRGPRPFNENFNIVIDYADEREAELDI